MRKPFAAHPGTLAGLFCLALSAWFAPHRARAQVAEVVPTPLQGVPAPTPREEPVAPAPTPLETQVAPAPAPAVSPPPGYMLVPIPPGTYAPAAPQAQGSAPAAAPIQAVSPVYDPAFEEAALNQRLRLLRDEERQLVKEDREIAPTYPALAVMAAGFGISAVALLTGIFGNLPGALAEGGDEGTRPSARFQRTWQATALAGTAMGMAGMVVLLVRRNQRPNRARIHDLELEEHHIRVRLRHLRRELRHRDSLALLPAVFGARAATAAHGAGLSVRYSF